MSGSDLRVVLVGWGAIGARVAGLLAARASPVRIVAVGVRDTGAKRQGLPPDTRLIAGPEALEGIEADLLVEAAGRAALRPWAMAALARGWDLAIASTSALTDADLLADLRDQAKATGAQILIPPGALGGIDALAAASRLNMDMVRHEIVKPARAWAGTAAEEVCDLAALTAPLTFFEGSARQAADRFPQNANVAVISAMAGIGLDRTMVALTADPGATMNRHSITARGDFGTMTITLENRPLAGNPKSSELTALSLLRLIENRAGGLVI
ncbi:aspartate dehydrogenase [Szabonella alba]|uniref:L-aspartate dehydrogenase n=1 Tax=Szabonella alba TaxID=2804194 RepID=A0A8K0V9V3_9RHOB|nr:aspartate dehydrogenase [Szabonella alba]MBL4917061.1 aspartate dehydrogenase [Szabonella alba]